MRNSATGLSGLDPAWFADPARDQAANRGPHLIVLDDFYPDPDAVRARALAQRFVQYQPPDPAIFGPGAEAASRGRTRPWFATAFLAYHGNPCANPFMGYRENPPELRERLAAITGDKVRAETWDLGGDGWNGAFHLIEDGPDRGAGLVHHHFKPGDLATRGWSGLVYLSPDAPPEAGTGIWRERASGRCIAGFGARFDEEAGFDRVLAVENRYNRLVLFRENVLHRVEQGFGKGRDARLTQTFFFETEGPAA